MTGKATLIHTRISYVFEIQNPFHEETLVNKLSNRGYTIVRNRIFRQGPIEAVLLQIATKDGISVFYDPRQVRSSVGVESKEYTKTLKYFHELKEILESVEIGKIGEAMIDCSVVYHVFSRASPRNIIKNMGQSMSDKLDGLIFDIPPSLIECTFTGSRNRENFSLHIAPLYSAQNYYYIRLAVRHDREDKIEEILKNSKDIIIQYQGKIENATN